MPVLEYALLRVLHSLHFLIALLTLYWRRLHWTPPSPLQITRRHTPRHLALLLVPESSHYSAATQETLLETVTRTVGWCRSTGIEKLTVYDSAGILVDCADQILRRASGACDFDGYESGSDVEYPPTPPSSDYSDSRPLSPEHGFQKETSVITLHIPEITRRRSSRYGLKKRSQERGKSGTPPRPPLTLYIASRQCSKLDIAGAATSLARRQSQTTDVDQQFDLSVELLNSILEGPHSLSAPDFLIIHHLRPSDFVSPPLELHGFPPWQIRLTEIYHCYKRRSLREWLSQRLPRNKTLEVALTEMDFRMALDEFAGAEMRFGK
ncbi:hypothetical protein B0H11DRAFT_2013831 [Mycena galericulata]|nr:hypothetical protein B0H11DRAFT_2013831 [Mycena galericulata]